MFMLRNRELDHAVKQAVHTHNQEICEKLATEVSEHIKGLQRVFPQLTLVSQPRSKPPPQVQSSQEAAPSSSDSSDDESEESAAMPPPVEPKAKAAPAVSEAPDTTAPPATSAPETPEPAAPEPPPAPSAVPPTEELAKEAQREAATPASGVNALPIGPRRESEPE